MIVIFRKKKSGFEEETVKNKLSKSKRQLYIKITSVVLIVLTFAFFGFMVKEYFNGKFDSVESLQKYIARFGSYGPIILTLFQALQVVIPILPGFLGCAVGAVLFGPVVGFLCNYIGISAGSIIAFFLARKFGKPLLDDLFPAGKYHKWSEWASRSKSYAMFLFGAMVLPLFPDDFFCYLTGLTEMKARQFIWIIVLGKPWCILAYSLGFSFIK